jgi:signal transduction histidine kinase
LGGAGSQEQVLEEQFPLQAELIERIDWLISLRWLAVVGTLLTIVVVNFYLPGLLLQGPLVAVTAAIALYNLLFFLYARQLRARESTVLRLRQSTIFVYVQIALDLIALTTLLHFAGGVENPFALFFVFHMIIASILLSPTASFLIALLASSLFAAMALLEYRGLVPHHSLVGLINPGLYRHGTYVGASILVMTITLFLVIYMTSSISVRLRARTNELLEVSRSHEAKSQELAELNAKLQKLDAARTKFMVTVTHELRAPVATIYSCLDLVLGGYASREKEREILERGQQRTTELLDLVKDLLELTGARQAEVQAEEAQAIQLADVLRDVEELMRVEAENKDLFLSVDIVPDLPLVKAKPDHIKAVWTNLISNAIKYTEPGGIVVASLTHNPGYVVGAVRDTGIGVAAEDLPKICEEFYRAANAKATCPQGTGVGLAIVKRMIENYGGKFWMESELGRGSKFTFMLPKAR